MNDLLIVLGMALAVYVPKLLPLVLLPERASARLKPWLTYVAPAVLGALVAPSMLAGGALGWNLVGYALAFAVAAVTRRLVLPLAIGMAAIAIAAVLQA